MLHWLARGYAQLTSPLVCSLPAVLDHMQQRAAADLLLLGQADPGAVAQAVQQTAEDTASGNKPGFFNFFANTFEVILKVCKSAERRSWQQETPPRALYERRCSIMGSTSYMCPTRTASPSSF